MSLLFTYELYGKQGNNMAFEPSKDLCLSRYQSLYEENLGHKLSSEQCTAMTLIKLDRCSDCSESFICPNATLLVSLRYVTYV